ncbi:MAG: HAD hydrolase-like protein [Planctomycetota bacterium]
MTPSHPTAQRPSWGPPVRGVFVDVLGTLIEPVGEDGTHFPDFDEASFYDGVLDGLFRVTQAGWKLYLIGNVPSVAFGAQTSEAWADFQGGFHAHLASMGIRLTRDYSCIDHPEGVKGRTRDSVYRLPGTGAMHHAAQADGIRLNLSWVVGDSSLDLVTGWRAGCRIAGVQTGEGLGDRQFEVEPELLGRSATGVLKEIARDMTLLHRVASSA